MVSERSMEDVSSKVAWQRLFELYYRDLMAAAACNARGQAHKTPVIYQKIMHALKQDDDLVAREQYYRTSYNPAERKAEPLNFFAMLHLLHNDWDRAAVSYQRSLEANPRQPSVLFSLGCMCLTLWHLRDGIACFRALIEQEPAYLPAYTQLARCYVNLGEMEDAADVLNRALRQQPHFPQAEAMLIGCYTAMRQKDKAEELARSALAAYPTRGQFFFFLTEVATLGLEDPLTLMAEQAAAEQALPLEDRLMFYFGLARVYDKAGEEALSFAALKKANDMKARTLSYDPQLVMGNFRTIKAHFTAENTCSGLITPIDEVMPVPIFIVGMPRSGTSLIEQILSAHPRVHGAGEVDYLQYVAYVLAAKKTGVPYPQCMQKLDEATARYLRNEYLRRLKAHDPKARYIVDKLPGNFMLVGMIQALFPEAVILHAKRSPEATCFSIYKQHFVEEQNYAYSLDSLRHAYGCYRDLMQYWHALYPARMYDVEYERLVEDFGPQLRRLLSWCGLPYDEACEQFHEASHFTRTASATQVTRPLYRDGLDDWKRYEKWLGKMS